MKESVTMFSADYHARDVRDVARREMNSTHDSSSTGSVRGLLERGEENARMAEASTDDGLEARSPWDAYG
jgi:hypothetical protein